MCYLKTSRLYFTLVLFFTQIRYIHSSEDMEGLQTPVDANEIYCETCIDGYINENNEYIPYSLFENSLQPESFSSEETVTYCSPDFIYHKRRCVKPICPEGTIWNEDRCQMLEYMTTVIELKNIITNTQFKKSDITTTTTESTATTSQATETNIIKGDCCSIITPRICKQYGQKWVCFNRRYKRCNSKLCTHPIIYLKVSMVIHQPPILIMPPNPPLEACILPGCDNAETVDCSGCASNLRESCSPYCYHYMCPNDACNFVDLQEYCRQYPGELGCTKPDGCIWDWCGEKCNE